MTLKSFHTDDPVDKFVAIASDGSCAEVFYKDGNGYTAYVLDGTVDWEWFPDAGYCWFMALPDDFEVWGEGV